MAKLYDKVSVSETTQGASGDSQITESDDLAPQGTIAARLLDYLSNRLETSSLSYKQAPIQIDDGWETSIYHFELQADEPLPPAFAEPLTLRLFAGGPKGIPQGRHHYAVLGHLLNLGYPVPTPILWEERCDLLGGPMLFMEQVPGPTLLQRGLSRPWTVNDVGSQMAQMQAKLHLLSVEDFPHPAQPLLERSLDEMRRLIDRYEIRAFEPALDWLQTNLLGEPASPCIVHLDFHPGNLIYRENLCPVVLDWDTADVGDPHADIAATLVILRCASNVGENFLEQALVVIGRKFLEEIYLSSYRRALFLDDQKLDYYEAWAILRRLCHLCRCLIAGPDTAGIKPSWCRHLHRDHLEALCAEFKKLSSIEIVLNEETWLVQPG